MARRTDKQDPARDSSAARADAADAASASAADELRARAEARLLGPIARQPPARLRVETRPGDRRCRAPGGL